MENRKFWLKILVMALVLGMTVVGCDNDSTDNSTDNAVLNGTWLGTEMAMKFNNGYYEIAYDTELAQKGTYTVNGNKITMTTTHLYGSHYDEDELEAEWYTKSELQTALVEGGIITADEFEETYADEFSTVTVTYAINGTTLTLASSDGTVYTFTKSGSNGNLNNVVKSIKLTGLDAKYSSLYWAYLSENEENDFSIGTSPYATISISNRTVTFGVYDLNTVEFDDETLQIIGDLWKGTGTYFVGICLNDGAYLDTYVSKNKISITTAVTEIPFSDFKFIKRWDLNGDDDP